MKTMNNNSNITNTTTITKAPYYSEMTTPWRIVFGILLTFYITFGCLSNGRVLFVLSRKKRHFRQDTAWILTTLVSVNFVASVTIIPILFTLTVLIPKDYSFLCLSYCLLTDCSIYANSFCFLLLGINRKDATLKPYKQNRVSVKRLKVLIPILCTSVIVLGIIFVVNHNQCSTFNPERQPRFSFSRLTGCIAFLMAVSGVLYSVRAYHLIRKRYIAIQQNLQQPQNGITTQLEILRMKELVRKSNIQNSESKTEVRINDSQSRNKPPSEPQDLKILRAIILVVVVFVVTYCPIVVAEIIIRQTRRESVIAIVLCRIIILTQNCLNPAAFSPTFLRCEDCKKNP